MRAAIAVLALALLGAGCYGLALVNWGGLFRSIGHAASCPQGQHVDVISWVPQYNVATKTVVITPLYGCVTS